MSKAGYCPRHPNRWVGTGGKATCPECSAVEPISLAEEESAAVDEAPMEEGERETQSITKEDVGDAAELLGLQNEEGEQAQSEDNEESREEEEVAKET